MTSIKTKDVTDALRFFVTNLIHLDVDDEGFLINGKKERFAYSGINKAETAMPIVLYQEIIPKGDYYTLNPFSEGIGTKTPPHEFFYTSLRKSLNARMSEIILAVVKHVLREEKKIDVDPSDEVAPTADDAKSVMDAVSGNTLDGKSIIAEIDEKTFSELTAYLLSRDALDGYLEPAYNGRMLSTQLQVPVLNDKFEKLAGASMRKKTVHVLRAITMNILGLTKAHDVDRYTSKATPNTPAQLSSWMQVLFKVYLQINQTLEDINSQLVVNLEQFKHHLDLLPEYFNDAKWMVQRSYAPTTTASPSAAPVVTPSHPAMAPAAAPAYHQPPVLTASTFPSRSPTPSSPPVAPNYSHPPAGNNYGSVGPNVSMPGTASQNTTTYRPNVASPMLQPQTYTPPVAPFGMMAQPAPVFGVPPMMGGPGFLAPSPQPMSYGDAMRQQPITPVFGMPNIR